RRYAGRPGGAARRAGSHTRRGGAHARAAGPRGADMICARALEGVPEVRPGDDLAALLAAARGGRFDEGEVLVIAHKVVSKAEGRVVRLEDVEPSPRALELAAELGKDDPRHVEVVLRETAEI